MCVCVCLCIRQCRRNYVQLIRNQLPLQLVPYYVIVMYHIVGSNVMRSSILALNFPFIPHHCANVLIIYRLAELLYPVRHRIYISYLLYHIRSVCCLGDHTRI